MAEKEQIKPLASVSNHLHSDDAIFLPPSGKLRRSHNYIKCCGCLAAFLLILAVVGIILGFTIFHIKTPDIKIDSLSLPNGALFSGNDVVLVATVSVKNPNIASFRYQKTSTKVYYGGTVIGEGETAAGEAEARRTTTMNLTVEIEGEKIMEMQSLVEDLKGGALNISSYTVVPGRVKIIGFIKKSLEVKMNCSITYYSKTQMIQAEDCNEHVELLD